MALLLHRSDRPLALADEFAALLAREPLDVFTPEIVVVGARGVERWLTQRLSHTLGATHGDDGVAAGLDVRAPESLTAMLLGRERDDPWHPDALVWPLIDALDAHLTDPGFETVARHLGAGPEPTDADAAWQQRARRSRRYAVARRLAGLLASYARDRPMLLAAWEDGRDEDGAGQELPADLGWQPMLWRATVALVLERGGVTESAVARQARVVAALRSGDDLPTLPSRLSLFGHTRLPASDLELIDALSTHVDVHLWLPHPSPQLWNALSERTGILERRLDDSAEAARHPLLGTLGRDARELQRSVLSHTVAERTGPFDANRAEPRTRLGLLQEDVRHNRPPSPDPAMPTTDRSIQVHACHGPARQVEVLREIVVALLDESDGRLQPRDILVMCPDIETFAPLIQATFGSTDDADGDRRHPGQTIRLRLADRSLSVGNPLIEVAERLLALVADRLTTTDVLDLLAVPAVRRRFHLDEDGLDRIAGWVEETEVRWGLDGRHRAEYGLAGLDANTWESGLDRLALGVAVSADSRTGAASMLPVDDVGSQAVPEAESLLELMDRLATAAGQVRASDGPRTARAWTAWLRENVLALVEVPEADRWQVARFEQDLALVGAAAGPTTPLRLTDMRVLTQQRWAARPTRANFRTGAITVCTMVPMRCVPHRVVIALGLDDGVYPRAAVVDGDDVLARRPLTGERDPRAEDGQLLLDAVMAAQETFIALFSGFDERTGRRRPPSVPLQQVIAAAARTGSGADVDADRLPFVHRHPLQAFDERNFDTEAFLSGGTYDAQALDGARALRVAREHPTPREPLVPRPLPARREPSLPLDDLVAFYEHPAREFLRRRLEITVPRRYEESRTQIPVTLDNLDVWRIGDRLLREVRSGTPLDEAVAAERRRGSLPPGRLADPLVEKVTGQMRSILAGAASESGATVDVLLDLPGGVRLRGTVSDVIGDRVETVTYSTVAAKHVIAAWVRLLALAASRPDRAWTWVLHGRGRPVTLTAPPAAAAHGLLGQLVEYRAKGMQIPLGLPPKTANAYATRHAQYLRRYPDDRGGAHQAALGAARDVWEKGRFPERDGDAWWARVHGDRPTVEDLDSHRTLSYWAPLVWGPIHTAGGRVR